MDLIQDQASFDELMTELSSVSAFALDTEFIREHTFRPELCLVQIAYGDQSVAIDPFANRLSE